MKVASTLKALAVFVGLTGSYCVGYWYGKVDDRPIDPVLLGDAPRLEPIAVPVATDPTRPDTRGLLPAHE